ncbi:MAG: hypothetical protein LKF61_01075 [Eggerthellaceae bacterium]|jgi:type II secretory pathway pseudopilin PulG|nr:hypothetical protein [Eggerthellaceae bacterium]
MKSKRTKWRTSGFTMMELLGALAIMVVMFLLAVPAFMQIQTNYQMMKLDATAKTIYTAAQDRLVSLQSTGRLQTVAGNVVATDQTAAVPADYPSDNGDDIELYYLSRSDANAIISNDIVTQDANTMTADLPGDFLIEMSPHTGEVYGVFYVEQGTISYGTISSLKSRSQADRTAAKIGYYGGNPISNKPEQKKASFDDLTLDVVNSEELYVKLVSSGFTQDMSGVDVTVVVETPKPWNSGTTHWSKTYDATSYFQTALRNDGRCAIGDGECDCLLDSMRTGLSISDITGGAIPCGSDLSISVIVNAGGKTYAKSYNGGAVNASFNSYDADTQTIYASSVRHINNLRSMTRDSSSSFFIGSNDSVSAIRLKNDISFDNWSRDSVSIQSLNSQGNATNPLIHTIGASTAPGYFSPIDLSAVDYSFGIQTISGKASDDQTQGYSLKNFVIGNGSDSTGLFSKVHASLSDITLVDPVVNGGSNTGALLGGSEDWASKLSNCAVKATNPSTSSRVSGTNHVGGLVGRYQGEGIESCSFEGAVSSTGSNVGGLVGSGQVNSFTNCSVKGSVSSSGDTVGGLIGLYENGSCSDCTAQVLVTGVNNIGGLIGTTKTGSTISRCTVHGANEGGTVTPCSVTSTGLNVGGLIGDHQNGTLEQCTTECNVTGKENVGGLMGLHGTSGGDTTDCKASGNISGEKTVGGFVGVSSNGNFTRCGAQGYFPDEVTTAIGCTVSGQQNIGGFAGALTGGDVRGSYAAVDVSNGTYDHSSNVGGFVGLIMNGWVSCDSCYSSGNVVANTNVGGFLGRAISGCEIKQCYSTSNVSNDALAADIDDFQSIGGFIGSAAQINVDSDASYGKVSIKRSDGTVRIEASDACGPFIGSSSANTFAYDDHSCFYLQMPGYNAITLTATTQPASRTYDESVLNTDQLTTAQSHPYDAALKDKNYPFAYATLDGQTIEHYGNWPIKVTKDYSGITQKLLSGNQSVGDTVLWNYVYANKRIDSNGYSKTSYSLDSGAIKTSAVAGTGSQVYEFMGQDNAYGPSYTKDDFSYVLSVKEDTYVRTDGTTPWGYSSASQGYEGNFVVYVGDKIQEAQQDCAVYQYDAGRASEGLAPYQRGSIRTITKTVGSTSFASYDINSFVATADWTWTPA